MSMLALGPEEHAAIRACREAAAAQPVTAAEVRRREALFKAGNLDPVPNPSVELPVGFSVSYSVEEQPVGLVRHASISVDRPGKTASFPATLMILDAFGFNFARGSALTLALAGQIIEQAATSGRVLVYTEPCGGGRMAVNFVESLDGKSLI